MSQIPERYWIYGLVSGTLQTPFRYLFPWSYPKDAFEWVARSSVALLYIACVATVIFIFEEREKQKLRQIREVRYINSPNRPVKRTIAGHKEPLYTQENRASYQRLTNLLYSNDETASRLVSATHKRFPDKSFQWVLEKTIDDLIRDRSR